MIETKLLLKLFPFLVVSLLLGNIFLGLSSNFIFDNSNSDVADTLFLRTDRRLMSKDLYFRNQSFDSKISYYPPSFRKSSENNENEMPSRFNFSKSIKSPYITYKISSLYDLIIDESTGFYPKVMEINASYMRFFLNFTIDGVEGLDNNAFENLTISNETDTYLIVPEWVSDDWAWTNFFDGALPTDNYSLSFSLNASVLSSLSLGNYNLTLHTYYNHNSEWRNSYDYIPLPMKDLRVSFGSITPSEFNNKLDTYQLFNISVQVTETIDGETYNYVQSIPRINDTQNQLINPNVTLISNSGDKSGILPVLRFTDRSQETEGRYFFEVNLSSSLAAEYTDGLHNLVVSVTSHDGIVANDSISNFEAQGTVLIARIKEISVGTNEPLNWSTLTNNGK
ncbi:MAG: hypothetical protein ACXACU_17255, partial [Candidatus Hodarchaeales archaeon]